MGALELLINPIKPNGSLKISKTGENLKSNFIDWAVKIKA